MPRRNSEHQPEKPPQTSLVKYRLHAIKGQEHLIPKYFSEDPQMGIGMDIQFFDLDSLVRMYGKHEMERYFARLGLRLMVAEKPSDSQ